MFFFSGLTDTVAMVTARHFGANPETVESNAFQVAVTERDALAKAFREQQALARNLESVGVRVIRLEPDSDSPDAIFPNNWFSTHEDGRIVLYPMHAPSRRRERLMDIDSRLASAGFDVAEITDMSHFETASRFLEGTGSLVLDRNNRTAFACPSARTELALAEEWCARFEYELCWFEASDPAGRPLYHTNVIMSIGPGIAVVCLDAVTAPARRRQLRHVIERNGQTIVELDWKQVEAFAGNQLFLQGRDGPVVALSRRAEQSLDDAQRLAIDSHARRVSTDIATIERHGGGSVRCMLAEIFLPETSKES